MQFDPIVWIKQQLDPVECNTVDFIYDHMESQSGKCLAGIYQPFNPANVHHYSDRGAALEFMAATGDGRLLDFGPGDGWPSLILAPYVSQVIGVDGSLRRVEVCRENANRMGIANSEFIHVAPGECLPFADGSFDAVAASTSVENTPDPRASLAELYRILKPGGRLRLRYEAMNCYRGGKERELWLCNNEHGPRHLVVMERLPEEERAVQYNLTIGLTERDIRSTFMDCGTQLDFPGLSEQVLDRLLPSVESTAICYTQHPSGSTWAGWMKEIGFTEVLATGKGNTAGRKLFDNLSEADRPTHLAQLDQLLLPYVEAEVATAVPLAEDPPLTAVK